MFLLFEEVYIRGSESSWLDYEEMWTEWFSLKKELFLKEMYFE